MTDKLPHGMLLACDTDPLSKRRGIGDIYVSPDLIAMKGDEYVREMVRRTIDAAWADAMLSQGEKHDH